VLTRTRVALGAIALCLLLSGCGAHGYPQAAGDEVGSLQAALQAYQADRPHDLASQASACRTALSKLGDKALPVPTHRYAREGAALNRAYRTARLGFRQCEIAARTADYPLMVAAMSNFDQANASISRAKSLAR
jgi:predicted secreted protein